MSEELEIRVLTVGEVLDEAFVLLRATYRRLLVFPILVFVPSAAVEVLIISQVGRLLGQLLAKGSGAGVAEPASVAALGALAVVAVQLLVGPAVTTALVRAVADHYLGRRFTVGGVAREALRFVPRAIALGVLLVLLFVAAAGVPLGVAGGVAYGLVGSSGETADLVYALAASVLAAFPAAALGLYVYLRYVLSFAILVVEDVPIRVALRRSAELMRGRYFAALGLGLVLLVVGLLLGFLASALVPSPSFELLDPEALRRILPQLVRSQALSTGLGEAMGMITRTYAAIAWTLFYFSARCEHEGFDLSYLAGRLGRGRP